MKYLGTKAELVELGKTLGLTLSKSLLKNDMLTKIKDAQEALNKKAKANTYKEGKSDEY